MPSNYTIDLKHGRVIKLTVQSGIVIEANDWLDWAPMLPFDFVRSYCERKGWIIVPEIEKEHTHEVIFEGKRYEFFWQGNALRRIIETSDGEERSISYNELPTQVKSIL